LAKKVCSVAASSVLMRGGGVVVVEVVAVVASIVAVDNVDAADSSFCSDDKSVIVDPFNDDTMAFEVEVENTTIDDAGVVEVNAFVINENVSFGV
jgi:hypothetical protein